MRRKSHRRFESFPCPPNIITVRESTKSAGDVPEGNLVRLNKVQDKFCICFQEGRAFAHRFKAATISR